MPSGLGILAPVLSESRTSWLYSPSADRTNDRRRPPLRARRIVLATLVALLSATALPPAYASPATDERDLVSRINRERTSRGLRALVSAGDLGSIARRHSERMASAGRVSHNRNLPNEVRGWRELAENVAAGPTARDVHTGSMRSSYHRGHILDPAFTEIGVGVAYRRNRVYVTEVFALRGRLPAAPPQVSRSRAPAASPRPVKAIVRPAPVLAPKPAPVVEVAQPRTISLLLNLLAMEEPRASFPARPRSRNPD